MILAINIIDGRGLSDGVHHYLLPKKGKVANAVLAIHFAVKRSLISCTSLRRRSASILKVGIAKLIKEDYPIV